MVTSNKNADYCCNKVLYVLAASKCTSKCRQLEHIWFYFYNKKNRERGSLCRIIRGDPLQIIIME